MSLNLKNIKNDKSVIDSVGTHTKKITRSDIEMTLQKALLLERKRAPIHIHSNFEEIPQRFVNCLNRDSYIRPHMHTTTTQWELMCILTGRMKVFFFDDKGSITNINVMHQDATLVIEIPPLCYHTMIAIEPSSYLEIRNCSFDPTLDRKYASWAPEENSANAKQYHQKLFYVI